MPDTSEKRPDPEANPPSRFPAAHTEAERVAERHKWSIAQDWLVEISELKNIARLDNVCFPSVDDLAKHGRIAQSRPSGWVSL